MIPMILAIPNCILCRVKKVLLDNPGLCKSPKKVSVRSGAGNDDFAIGSQLVNQQKISTNMAFPKTFPFSGQFVAKVFRGKWRIVCNQQQHRFFQAIHIVAS